MLKCTHHFSMIYKYMEHYFYSLIPLHSHLKSTLQFTWQLKSAFKSFWMSIGKKIPFQMAGGSEKCEKFLAPTVYIFFFGFSMGIDSNWPQTKSNLKLQWITWREWDTFKSFCAIKGFIHHWNDPLENHDM